ncbi:MAG: insulinase family protein, partial [Spirulina sp. DLM2.Bin59]
MSAQPISLSRLTNGITVITIENRAADLIAARCFFRAGGRWETPHQAGISHLLAAVMTKGTQGRTAPEIADQVESMGASLGTDAAADYFTLGLKTVTADFAPILNLAAEILRSPSFPPPEVELEQQLTLQNIRAQSERPFSVAFQQLRQAMYGEHPYGLSILGTPETLDCLTTGDLKDYHQTYFRPDNLVISLSGRIEPERAMAEITAAFGDWRIPDAPLPIAPQPPSLPPPSSHKIHQAT